MRAYSTLIGMIILLAFLGIVTAGMSFLSVSELKSNSYVLRSQDSQQHSEACVDEVLRRLRDDLNYPGGSIPLSSSVQCVSTVSGDATQKTISATVSDGVFQHSIVASIAILTDGQANNFRFTSWQEQ